MSGTKGTSITPVTKVIAVKVLASKVTATKVTAPMAAIEADGAAADCSIMASFGSSSST